MTAKHAFETEAQLRLLLSERRRAVIRYLAEQEERVVRLADVASAVTDRAPGDRSDVRIRLHHVDLPMLDAAGLVEYDVERHRVVPEPERLAAFVADAPVE